MNQDLTSLERFVRNRGVHFIPKSATSRGSYLTHIYVGSALILAAAGLATTGVAVHVPPLEMASLGPFIAGVTNVIVGSMFKAKSKHQAVHDLRMTPEAKAFLIYLARHFSMRRFEWNDPSINQYMVTHHARGFGSGYPPLGARGRHPKDAFSPELFLLLERASFSYNRICGILETGVNQAPFQRVSRASQDAADETMLEILHHAAMISRYPESADSGRESVEGLIRSLGELGDRLEAIRTRTPSLTDRLAATSAIETVIEELKLEEMARSELTLRPEHSDELRENFS